MRSNSKNLLHDTWRFAIAVLFFLFVTIGLGACLAQNKLMEPASTPLPLAAPKLTRSISLVAVDGDVELLPAGKDVPAMASERFVYVKDGLDSATVTIYQSDGSLRETIAEVDVPVAPMKDSNIVITVSVDSQKQLRLKTSVMESAVVKEFGPFPVE